MYLLNFVTEPYYTEELVENERGIILEEILTHMNMVDEKFYYKFCDNVFVNDSNKYQVGGIDTDVKSGIRSFFVNCHDSHPFFSQIISYLRAHFMQTL